MTQEAVQIPLPQPDRDTAEFWEAAKRHELRIQRCKSCSRMQHFPGPICTNCLSDELDYALVSGKGRIYTFVVVHHVITPGFEGRAPYAVAWIDLPEQQNLRFLSDIVNCDASEVRIGMPVEVVFDDVTDEITIPRFQPARGQADA